MALCPVGYGGAKVTCEACCILFIRRLRHNSISRQHCIFHILIFLVTVKVYCIYSFFHWHTDCLHF